MQGKYDHKEIELKWRKKWQKSKLYRTKEDSESKKCYVLDMFPYPSGEGLHVGHPKGYIATDVYSRMKKMQGMNILHPMGWDAFGLPAENYAIKNKVHPRIAVEKNIKRYKEQLSILGFNYDWEREINTTDPNYYKWTQWIFLKLLEKGLAYESYEPINWCPVDKTGLANEDVEDGRCERCGALVEKRPMRQWVLRITDYAEKMLDGLKDLNWPESIKESQKNWIGKSEGVNFKCRIKDLGIEVEMYNSVPQTYHAETFTVIAPEHPLVFELVKGTSQEKPVMEFVERIKAKKAGNRFDVEKDIEGISTGRFIEKFADTGRDLPIWVASYVLYDYGTGIVNCSVHDERDFAFAKKYNLPLHPVMFPIDPIEREKIKSLEYCYAKDPQAVIEEPKKFRGRRWGEARHDIIRHIVEGGFGAKKINYKLKDWIFSRQRYWGEPIPVIHCEHCKEKKQKVLIIHGFEGDPSEGFKPWLKKELEKQGFEVKIPKLPNAEHPSFNEIFSFLKKETKDFSEEDIIVGHSMGAHFALHLALRRKFRKIVLVAPAFGGQNLPYEKWDEVYKDPGSKALQKTLKENIVDLSKIKVDRKAAIFGIDDPDIPIESSMSLDNSWQITKLNDVGHMSQIKDLPQLLEMILKEKNTGVVPVPEKDLPVELPDVEFYEPTDTGESPLANIQEWVNVKCPKCRGNAKRETNTMPQWAGSSWYYLRYEDPKNKKTLVDKEKEKYWSPVDFYVGGAEHATRHLIYARFWHKFLFDIGVVNYPEPFTRLQNVGLIGGADGRKMSKRFGNVVNPDEMVELYGADTFRLYEMFMGPFDQAIPWSTEGMIGPRRFLERLWRMKDRIGKNEDEKIRPLLHQTIKKVGEDIETFHFNTAISSMMILLNEMEKTDIVSKGEYEIFLKLLAPFAPHICEELWITLGNKTSIHESKWPSFDPMFLQKETLTLAIQVNGKVRGNIEIKRGLPETEIEKLALSDPEIERWISGKKVEKVLIIKEKIVSIVAK